MGKYVSKWQDIKDKFEKSTNLKRPTETVKRAIVGTVQKSSGLTPVLQEIDTALEKKQRYPLEKALNKYHSVQEPYVSFLREEMKKYPADQYENIALAFATFMREMLMIEQDVAADAKALQEQKSPGATGIKWLFLEADVKATIEKAKKDFSPFATLEKRFGLIKKADPAFKAAQDYTKAAARTEVNNALAALKDFQTKALSCANACDAPLKDTDANKQDKYIAAVKSFQKAMQDLRTSRAATQIKNLEAAAAG